MLVLERAALLNPLPETAVSKRDAAERFLLGTAECGQGERSGIT